MSLRRIRAVLLQEFFVSYRSVEVIFEIFIFSLIALLLSGLFALYLMQAQSVTAAKFLLLGTMQWEIMRVVQYSVSVGALWNVWSRNLSNMFISPLRVREYFFAHTLSGIARSVLLFFMNAALAMIAFQFNIYQIGGLNIFLSFIILAIFAMAVALVILGLIFRYGTRIQAFAWGLVPVLQPLTANFFPVKILPLPLQYFAYLFPCTYVFEAGRYSLMSGNIAWNDLGIAFALSLLDIGLAILFFNIMFRAAKDSGQFARNEA